MKGIFADIKQEWENLSDDHEKLLNDIHMILKRYSQGEDVHPSFLITGVFGAGKTTLMIHIFKVSLNQGLLPFYMLAEDIFNKVRGKTPYDVKEEINNLISILVDSFKCGNFEQIKELIRAEKGHLKADLLNLLQENQNKVKYPNKVVLLVDELEDQYKLIRDKVGPDPLRSWLEDRSYLKFLSLTPSGVYDLGGADESRLQKLSIPPVSIEYIRNRIGLPAGKANALWWLSRGIPRHIIKNLNKIKDISEKDGDYKISQTLESLDRIGKEPGRVPAVELKNLKDYSKIRFLIDLIPQPSPPYRGFLITKGLREGELSNTFQKAFNLSDESDERRLTLLIAHYFKLTAMNLSDEDFNAYIDANEINDFMELSLDILLENEYKNPIVEKNMPKLLSIYEKLKNDPTFLLTTLITAQVYGLSFTDVNKRLPFTISEIRRLFPLPMANPIIKSNPDDVIREVEGKGRPICKINESSLFFASYRDLEHYVGTDEFKDKVLPDEKYLIVLIPDDEFDKYEKAIKNPTSKNIKLLRWLNDNDKLRVVKLPPSIKLFLLSLYGYSGRIPYNISDIYHQIKASEDPLLVKKFELYYSALQELINDNKPTPKCFFKDKPEPKGLRDVWGIPIREEHSNAVIAGLALSFYRLSHQDKRNLILLRELFRTKERRGNLADIKVGRALPTLADDLLPRKDRKGNVVDAPSIEDLKDFWSKDEVENLDILARLLELSEFKKLHPDPNYRRILEAFWRAIRDEFDVEHVEDLKRRLDDIISKIETIQSIEIKLQQELGLDLAFDEKQENIIKALDGLKKLGNLTFSSKLPNYILQLYLDATLDKIERIVNSLYKDVQNIDKKANNLKQGIEEILRYLSDKQEILDFISDKISFKEIKQELEYLKKIDNSLSLSDAEKELRERLSFVNTVFSKFGELEEKLNNIKDMLSTYNLLEV